MTLPEDSKHRVALGHALEELGVEDGILITFDDPDVGLRATTTLMDRATKRAVADDLMGLAMRLREQSEPLPPGVEACEW